MSPAPLVLTVAGFDPSARAGLLADTWAIAHAGGAPLAVVTALTAQGPQFVCVPVAPRLLGQQLRSALASGPVRAVKLGMVPDRGALAQIVRALRPGSRPIVVDPVVRTSRGERLSALDPADYRQLAHRLGPRNRVVITPNREELGWLEASPAQLLRLGFWGVVVKGSQSAVDEVFGPTGHQVLGGARLPRSTSHHRGTGCRFGSGLATALARGEDLVSATRSAKRLVRRFLRSPIIR